MSRSFYIPVHRYRTGSRDGDGADGDGASLFFGVAVNRAFGLSDTVIYLPLLFLSLIGLVHRRRWALPITAAVMGISAYWAVTCSAIFVFVSGTPGYRFVPGPEYWISMGIYVVVGIWGVFYLVLHGDNLVTGDQEVRL